MQKSNGAPLITTALSERDAEGSIKIDIFMKVFNNLSRLAHPLLLQMAQHLSNLAKRKDGTPELWRAAKSRNVPSPLAFFA